MDECKPLASGDDATVTVNITDRQLRIKQAAARRTAAEKAADDEAFMEAQVKAFNQQPAEKRLLPNGDTSPPEKAVEVKAAVGQCRLTPV